MSRVSNVFSVRVVGDTLPAWAAGLAVHEVALAPNSDIRAYTSILANPALHGTINNIVDAWGGACVRDSGSHYIIHGGGHQDYGGNEIYSYSLETGAWVRKWGPTPSGSFSNNLASGVYLDGNPAAIHTYMGLIYQPHEDRILRPGRTSYASTPVAYAQCDAWVWSDSDSLYNTPQASTPGYWHTSAIPNRPLVPTQSPSFIAHDKISGDLFAMFDTSLYRYTRASNAWSAVTYSGPAWRGGTLCYHPPTQKLIGFNNHDFPVASKVLVVDFVANTRTNVTVTGNAAGITAMTRDDGFDYAGACYDPETGLIVFWPRTGGQVLYTLDPTTMVVGAITLTGATLPTPTHGPCGRLQHVPEMRGVAVMPSWDSGVYFFRTI